MSEATKTTTLTIGEWGVVISAIDYTIRGLVIIGTTRQLTPHERDMWDDLRKAREKLHGDIIVDPVAENCGHDHV